MEHLLNDTKFQNRLKELAKQTGEPIEDIQSEAEVCLKELYTQQSPVVNAIGVQAAQYILSRAYEDSIDVNATELKDLAKLMRNHSVAFVMTHKTYIDMFVLAVVLARHGLPLPYIFSGINMSFLGLGELGRRTGAIFIRRSFKENEVYKACLRHFISTLVDDGQHFMWAIEGTRSRTGKIVWPKMGILKYIREAEKQSRSKVKYVPVSIVYDLIPDVADMTKEARGMNKSPESLLWFLNYVRKMGKDYGKISLRLAPHLDVANLSHDEDIEAKEQFYNLQGSLSRMALNLVHEINHITPVTTSSLICAALLSKFALSKRGVENLVSRMMALIESHKQDALVDRGKPIGQSIQTALNLLANAKLVKQIGDGIEAKFAIIPENYLNAAYYATMASHHFYPVAFVEIALQHVSGLRKDRLKKFWHKIMALRDQFKFEFFYADRARFSDRIERDLEFMDPNWVSTLSASGDEVSNLLRKQKLLVSEVVLGRYIEAYRVVAYSLLSLEEGRDYSEEQLMRTCLFLGEEMHWKGQIHRLESVSKPYITNGLRLAGNRDLIPKGNNRKTRELQSWLQELDDIAIAIKELHTDQLLIEDYSKDVVPIERKIVPGSKTASITDAIMQGEEGPHIGAFFDLDRTLIAGFSAKEFLQTRLMSGKMTSREMIAQFSGAMVYALGNKNFAGLASIGAQGVKGIDEQVFIDVGEEVYLKHLSKAIYPESRALVEAHLAKGHTVAIVSAATPYQVRPVARDLGIDHIMCSAMEVEDGKFTGKIIDPPCWGEGKSQAAIQLSDEYGLDLTKSYFYTDSSEDMPLMEIVGNPVAVNPDNKLSSVAFQNDWTIFRFNDKSRPGYMNMIRTGLTFGSLIPAAMTGIASGAFNLSWRDGVNSMMSVVGDLGTKLAGIKLVVKGRDNLWSQRPAVFLFNHQSNVDFLITAKLLRKDAVGIAKKELQFSPIGPIFKAAGVIFVDRANKEKAIEALKPAVEALKNGTSVGIAPEGTRSYDYTLGKFKKGAFHLAMQAGVPIVPIVIKNAHDVMPRGSNIIQPTVVEVVILKPISTHNWTKDNMNTRIKKVRNQYLKELGQLKTKKKKTDKTGK